MANYYYNKYNLVDNSIYKDPNIWIGYYFWGSTSEYAGYQSYGFADNHYYVMGWGAPATVVYELSSGGQAITRETLVWVGTYYEIYRSSMSRELQTYFPPTQGSLVESNIIAADGTHPNNGSDGLYWYVKQGPVSYSKKIMNITFPAKVMGVVALKINGVN